MPPSSTHEPTPCAHTLHLHLLGLHHTMHAITDQDHAACDQIYDETACGEATCDWHENIYKCWAKGEDVPCVEYHYMGQDECPDTCKCVVCVRCT